jgi:hypothetical protein
MHLEIPLDVRKKNSLPQYICIYISYFSFQNTICGLKKMIQKFKMLPFKMLDVGLFKAFFAIFDVLETASHEPFFPYKSFFRKMTLQN